MTQVARVMEINHHDALDPDVIHATRQMPVVGTNRRCQLGSSQLWVA